LQFSLQWLCSGFAVALQWLKMFDFQYFAKIMQVLDFQCFLTSKL
jgi:hypothetical protein